MSHPRPVKRSPRSVREQRHQSDRTRSVKLFIAICTGFVTTATIGVVATKRGVSIEYVVTLVVFGGMLIGGGVGWLVYVLLGGTRKGPEMDAAVERMKRRRTQFDADAAAAEIAPEPDDDTPLVLRVANGIAIALAIAAGCGLLYLFENMPRSEDSLLLLMAAIACVGLLVIWIAIQRAVVDRWCPNCGPFHMRPTGREYPASFRDARYNAEMLKNSRLSLEEQSRRLSLSEEKSKVERKIFGREVHGFGNEVGEYWIELSCSCGRRTWRRRGVPEGEEE